MWCKPEKYRADEKKILVSCSSVDGRSPKGGKGQEEQTLRARCLAHAQWAVPIEMKHLF